jgi:thiaminase/transcriptional activator TenA
MSFAQELMDSVADIWERCYKHPFVQGLADGSVARESFRDYLIQDTLYLKEYTKVFAYAFIKADDIEVMRHLYRDMQCVLSDETQTHIAYLRDFSLTEADALAAEVKGPNREYLDYMLTVGKEDNWLAGFISTMPCTLSYYHVAVHARAESDRLGNAATNYYRAWADFYAGSEYEAIYDDAVAFIDEVTAEISEAEKTRLKQIFARSSAYELGFWNMAAAG